MATRIRKPKITAKQEGGDDGYCYVVRVDGKEFVNGLTRSEVPYYKEQALKAWQNRNRRLEDWHNHETENHDAAPVRDAKWLKAELEKFGFGIAHVRRVPRGIQLRAYVAVHHKDHPDVDELRYDPANWPSTKGVVVSCYAYTIKANGYTQYDRYLGELCLSDGGD